MIRRRDKEAATVVPIEVPQHQEREEHEINRIVDERMANPSPGGPIEDVKRETLARSE
ncbi:type II toxin-antitoxin system prevent-host-death family antitoxin [Kitasatospora sp. NPDC001159]